LKNLRGKVRCVNIEKAHQYWTQLGKEDAMWAVLTDDAKKGNKWDEAEFFQTGRAEIGDQIQRLRDAGIPLNCQRALDFGCGPGRLSQALADYFSMVDGVDISSSMIEKANALNRKPDSVHYHLNTKSDLSFLSGSYDFIYSAITLQHIPPQFQESYISEFVRLLKPGGVARFQTIHARSWRGYIPNWFAEIYRSYKYRGRAYIPIYGLSASCVRRAVSRRGGVIRKHEQLPYKGWESRFAVDVFIVLKPAS
jgi:2-polyprenyl-3-methyl-5-hydroxy-6-metoxy-1,4-benzoquinol methylase